MTSSTVHTVLDLYILCNFGAWQLCEPKTPEIAAKIFHHDCQPDEWDIIGPVDWWSVVVDMEMHSHDTMANRKTS
jgi:hypothetical protein